MEKYIYKYLSATYYIETSDAGNDGIYVTADERRYKAPINGDKLLKELVTVFYVDEVQLKAHVEAWAATIKPDIDLEWFWKEMEMLLPLAMKVAAQTVGLDLVAVQPMSMPKMDLIYGDFVYGEDAVEPVTGFTSRQIPNRNGRVYDEERYRQNVMQLYQNQQNHIVGELDHVTPPIEININPRDEDSSVYKALQKWQSLIGISSRQRED